jgi:hypothetical protein
MTCQALQWYKADGEPKEMSARVAMLRMQDDGLIATTSATSPRRVLSCATSSMPMGNPSRCSVSAAWQTASRDPYIAWSHGLRQKNLHLIVNKASMSCSCPLPATMQAIHAS